MTRIDLTPLYRSSIGFDRLGSLLDASFQTEKASTGYPPYDIEILEENSYSITLAIAGFKESDLDIKTENGVLTVSGKQGQDEGKKYLHQGIAKRSFERKFNLADHVEVTNAKLADGLLTIELVREIPEAMKPKKISINSGANVIEHKEKVA